MIEKTKRKCLCCWCKKPISLKYRASNNGNFFHLSCYRKQVVKNFEFFKKELKELNKTKYKKIMILEGLE